MKNQKSAAAVASQALAKKIVDKIKSGVIVMGPAQELKGKDLKGTQFDSTPLKDGTVVSVNMIEEKDVKNPKYKITYAGKVTYSFRGTQARRAYKILTKEATDNSIPAEDVSAIEKSLAALG